MSKYGIYRIIGNENPPRDIPGRRLEILKLILDSEPEFEDTEKWYILNRIYDSEYFNAVQDLLLSRGLLGRVYVITADPYQVNKIRDWPKRVRVAVGINDARNTAIRHGKSRHDTVIVLDGDCCFDRTGWQRFTTVADENPNKAYLSIPHVTVSDSEYVNGFNLPAHHFMEPMIAFRKHSINVFDACIPFGCEDKLDLLYRLGHDRTPLSGHCKIEGLKTVLAGYVCHLRTGDPTVAVNLELRQNLRRESMRQLLERIRTVYG